MLTNATRVFESMSRRLRGSDRGWGGFLPCRGPSLRLRLHSAGRTRWCAGGDIAGAADVDTTGTPGGEHASTSYSSSTG